MVVRLVGMGRWRSHCQIAANAVQQTPCSGRNGDLGGDTADSLAIAELQELAADGMEISVEIPRLLAAAEGKRCTAESSVGA